MSGVSNQLVDYGKRIESVIDISKLPNLEEKIRDIAETQMIDLEKAMGSLIHVGGYLQLAYAGSRGFSCNVKIVTILCDYQRLVVNSNLACDKFVNSCFFAIKQDQLAIKVAERSSISTSMKLLLTCEKVVNEMIKVSDQLVNECQELCNLSKNALEVAAEDDVCSRQQKKEIIEAIAKLKAEEEVLKSKRESLDAVIEEERELERVAASKADHEQQRAFALLMCQTFLKPLNIGENLGHAFGSLFSGPIIANSAKKEKEEGSSKTAKFFAELLKSKSESKQSLIKNEASLEAKEQELKRIKKEKTPDLKQKKALKKEIRELKILVEKQRKENEESNQVFKGMIDRSDKQAQNYAEKESLAAQRRRELENEQMKCNAGFAKTVSELKSKHEENDELGKAIKSLEVAIKALGQVKATFEKSREFWNSVHFSCKSLSLTYASIETLAEDAELKELWVEQLRENQMQWVYLGALNALALKFITPAKEKVDSIMSNLPTKEEGDKIIEASCNEIESLMQRENRFLELSQSAENEKEKEGN